MAPKRKIIDAIALQNLFQQGVTAIQAARALSTSRRVVLRTARSLGTPFVKSKKSVFSPHENDQLLELYSKNLNDYEVAKEMHVGRSRLREWRRANSIASHTTKKGLTSAICPDVHRRVLSGETLTNIGSSYGVRRTSIARLLKKNQLVYPEYRPPTEEWVSDYHLTDYQTQFLIGDLFGDGGLCSTSEDSAYFHAGQSVSQEMFIRWRYEAYAPLISNVHVNLDHNSIGIKTWTCHDLGYWYKIFYGTGEKVLVSSMVAHMTPVGLAAWYMGDGSLGRNTPYYHVGLQVDLVPIAKALSDKFGFLFDARKHEHEWHLWIRDRDSFFNMVAPHVIPYFEYKIQNQYKHLVASKLNHKSISVITGESFRSLGTEDRDKLVDSFSTYFMSRGLTYPYMNLRDINRTIADFKNLIIGKRSPKEICAFYAPYRFGDYKAGSSPLRIWQDKDSMEVFVRKILYRISGQFCDTAIWLGLEERGVPAIEDPSWSAGICRSLLPHGGKVLDISVGYGERMLGCSSCLSVVYVGIEPRKEAAVLLESFADKCREIYDSNVGLIKDCFEDCILGNDSFFDIIFMDPPSYGEYSYGFEEKQCQVRYPYFSTWLEEFWIPSLHKCLRHLAPEGTIFVRVIGSNKDVAVQNAVDIFSEKLYFVENGEWMKFIWRNSCE